MKLLFDSFWRAFAYCTLPRVIGWSLLPLVLMVVVSLVFAQWGWWPTVNAVQQWLDGGMIQTAVFNLLDWLHLPQLKTVMPSLVVLLAIIPFIVIVCILLVAATMTPSLVKLVVERRFPGMERKQGAGWFKSLLWTLGHVVAVLGLLLLSLPFFVFPPLMLVIHPLIWGWFGYRVMSFDALAEHASQDERRYIMHKHRLPLLFMGVVTGFLGALPTVVWASTAVFVVAFMLLVPVAIWIYTAVIAFSALWFCHFCLAALQQYRAQYAPAPASTGVATTLDVAAREVGAPATDNVLTLPSDKT